MEKKIELEEKYVKAIEAICKSKKIKSKLWEIQKIIDKYLDE
jgi:hypothetical protein